MVYSRLTVTASMYPFSEVHDAAATIGVAWPGAQSLYDLELFQLKVFAGFFDDGLPSTPTFLV